MRESPARLTAIRWKFATRLASSEGVVIGFRFSGKLSGDSMSGELDMGEHLDATWTARRHTFGGVCRRGNGGEVGAGR